MSFKALEKHDPILFGANEENGLVAVEHVEKSGKSDEMALFVRDEGTTKRLTETFRPFVVAEKAVLEGCAVPFESKPLHGDGELNLLATFDTWKDYQKAVKWLAKSTGATQSAPDAPYLGLNDPVNQFLAISGRTLFKGMGFHQLRRMQVDIECIVSDGFEFCNADREGDRIVAIAMSDESGWVEVLEGHKIPEKELLERLVATVRERDPDTIEGHNIFNFDLPYIATRCRKLGVRLALGRDDSEPTERPSRLNIAERSISYQRFDVFGRHVVDTLFLVHFYDVSHRSLDGFGLKEVAIHFGFAAPDRTYIEGNKIAEEFKKDPARVMRYAGDDINETRQISDLLSISNFVQAQMLPYSYQNICVRGNATKIDSMLLREYLRQGVALPKPDAAREFSGGYTDMFVQGVVENVHHCDVRSLYPSLMLVRKLGPRKDRAGVFLAALESLRSFRLEAKEQMQKSRDASESRYFDGLQSAFKILINSFYGYLGFSQGRFCDFDMAEKVTSEGRALLKDMVEWLGKHGARPVEIDTDGIYFVPPKFTKPAELEKFRKDFAGMLPKGIELEFDGEYRSMYSHKMKNYALLTESGEMIIKGAALKSRGLEKFQRMFMREALRMKLEGREKEIAGLRDRYAKSISGREWSIEMLAKTETLQDSPATYSVKMGREGRAKSAAYELAIKSGRDFRAGDQVSYYVTGEKKSVAVHEKAKLVSEWNPGKRDENVAYYLAKLDALCQKFIESPKQGELDLQA